MDDLKLVQVRKKLGALELQADFEVKAGERAAVVSRSGGGKTTLLRIIAGLERLERSEAGKIFLGSQEITNLPPEKRQIGLVFQEQALFPSLSVVENAFFGLKMRGVPKDQCESEALVWLERVGLKSLANTSVETLSGGERQRVAFVRTLIWKPRLMLLDEPFSALDASLRATLRHELVELHKLWPVPLLFVTHDEADLEAVATLRLKFEEDIGGKLRRFVN